MLRIREIHQQLLVTPVPHARPHIHGLAGLRGQLVTVIDLGRRLSLPAAADESESHVILLRSSAERARLGLDTGDGELSEELVGLLVGAIGDVLSTSDAPLERVPANVGASLDIGPVSAVARAADGLTLLLDVDRLLGARETSGDDHHGPRAA